MKYVIWAMTAAALIVSFAFDRQKTLAALKMAGKRLAKITTAVFLCDRRHRHHNVRPAG